MASSRDTLTRRFIEAASGWLLLAYRRPLHFLLLLSVVPVLLVVLATRHVNVRLAEEQALLNLRVTARVAAEAIDQTLARAGLFQEALAAQPAVRTALTGADRSAAAEALIAFRPLLPEVLRIRLIDARGRVVAVEPPDADPAAPAEMPEPLPDAEAAGRSWVSPVYVSDDVTLEKVVEVVLPVARSDRDLGRLEVRYPVSAIRAWIQRIRVEPEGFLYVVDQRKQLVVYPFQVLPGRPKIVSDWPPVVAPLPAGGSVMVFASGAHHRRWLAGVYPIGTTGWRVVAVQPVSAVARLISRVFWPLAVLILALTGILMWISRRWASLQALNLRLLQQNAKLLKRSQQRWTLEKGRPPGEPRGRAAS